MANDGKQINLGSVYATMEVRLDKFGRDIERAKKQIKKLGDEVDKTKIGEKIEKETDQASKAVSRFRQQMGQTATVIRNMQVAFSGFTTTAMIGAVALAVGALIELLGAAVAAGGALLALPGILGIVMGAFATVKVATAGMGEAFKALADGDAEKLAEAMERLSPAARDFVRAAGGFREAFKPIQQAVQEAFFQDLAEHLTALGDEALPVLDEGLNKVARSMNKLLKTAAKTARETFFTKAMARMFNSTAKSIDTLEGAVRPLLIVITRLMEVAEPFAEAFVDWIANGIKSAAAFLETEAGAKKMTETIERGVYALQQIGGLISAVATMFVTLFDASNEGGASLITNLTEMITKFNEWAKTTEGQEKLRNTFDLLGQVLRDVLIIIGLVLTAFVNLTSFIGGLPEPLQSIAAAMIAIGIVAVPLIIYFGTLAGAVSNLIKVAPLMKGVMVGALDDIAKAAQRAKDGFDGLSKSQADAESKMSKMGGAAKTATTGISDIIAGAIGGIAAMFGEKYLGAALNGLKAPFLKFLPWLTGTILPAIGTALAAITPVGWIAIAVAAIVGLFVLMYNKVDWFREGVDNIVGGIVDVFNTVVESVSSGWSSFVDGISSAWNTMVENIKSVWNGIVEAVSGPINQIIDGVKLAFDLIYKTIYIIIGSILIVVLEIFLAIYNAIATPLTNAWNFVTTTFTNIWNTIVTIANQIWTSITTTFGFIVQSVSDAFTSMWNSITQLMGSIGQAIADGWNATWSFITGILGRIGAFIAEHFGWVKTAIDLALGAIYLVFSTAWNKIWGFIGPVVTNIWNTVRDAFDRVKNAIQGVMDTVVTTVRDKFNQVMEKVRSIKDDIVGFFRDAGNWLKDAGKNIIDGLIGGINSKFESVKKRLGELTSQLPEWKGPARVDKKLLVNNGVLIMQGLERGLVSQFGTIEKTLNSFTGQLGGGNFNTLGVSASSTQPLFANARTASTDGATTNNTSSVTQIYGNINIDKNVDNFDIIEKINRGSVLARKGMTTDV